MGLKPFLVGVMPFAAMVMVESFDVGLTTLSKAAMTKGMSHFVFVVYSNAIATLILLPSSFFLTRTKRPPLTFSLLCKFFLLSLVGITGMQNFVFTGINYSSPTLGSAMSNLIPAFTFLLAVIFRMENLDMRSSRSRIKIIGTLVSISGALIVTLYKGSPIGFLPIPSPSSPSEDSLTSQPSLLAMESNWVLGGFFLAIACLSAAIWNTSQAAILKGYPSEATIVAFYCLFGTVQCAAVSLVAERNNPNAWRLGFDIELISVIYSAVFGSVVTFSVLTWCIHKKGPVFVAMFKPLGIAIAALLSVIFLGETLYVGSVIGAIVIVVGFYGVMWAQSKEENQEIYGVDTLPSSAHKTPLLQTHWVE
ncbi:nodulin MtN21 /EamA-like transporter family protein [Actinidia rufa]|uniref:WAT1-related protein n=1 Tax=Actinidia rufa TaxID=165716 RepID=A0A7J0DEN5_9ERIC|nr:nodulin MtN21 /EamA-like transporter family protein [Actinidia rufa]